MERTAPLAPARQVLRWVESARCRTVDPPVTSGNSVILDDHRDQLSRPMGKTQGTGGRDCMSSMVVDENLLLAFIVTTGVPMIVPGPDMLFVLGGGMRSGPRAGLLATCG
jgi:hypothetical protein